jgi:hypothetical protein
MIWFARRRYRYAHMNVKGGDDESRLSKPQFKKGTDKKVVASIA